MVARRIATYVQGGGDKNKHITNQLFPNLPQQRIVPQGTRVIIKRVHIQGHTISMQTVYYTHSWRVLVLAECASVREWNFEMWHATNPKMHACDDWTVHVVCAHMHTCMYWLYLCVYMCVCHTQYSSHLSHSPLITLLTHTPPLKTQVPFF